MSFRFYLWSGPGPVRNTNTFYWASTGPEITKKLEHPKVQVQFIRDAGIQSGPRTHTGGQNGYPNNEFKKD